MTSAPVEAEINVLLVESAGRNALELGPQLVDADATLTIRTVTTLDAARQAVHDDVIDCVVCRHDPPTIDGVENALVHNDDPDPTLRIEAGVDDDWTDIRLHDDARGIPDDEWQVITGEAEITQLTHSSGLGLWLVRWVIDSYRGEVRRRRTADGTTIELHLRPVAAEQRQLDDVA
ncbi:ATP-binding protein [Haloplanus aerogenes]|uniref:Histidine kinase/HSP90-like ATPase domain-containing protein n=1 Tax=Haloplanus aerogenes TaxID=660522 RepID=A0A3G8QY20_9EURY|nr:ATP-binding protein [Haloplanus aerogenes]AZH25714.1 hypothetical protein DU502_10125 [Haloplanus aerogenes]